jgi:hypothetical protein
MDVPKKNPNQLRTPEEGLPKEANPEVPKVRERFLMINPQDFLMLFEQGLVLAKRTKVFTGVPADAKVTGFTVDHVRGGVILIVRSDEYDEIPVTEMRPVQHIEIEIGVKNATKSTKNKRK